MTTTDDRPVLHGASDRMRWFDGLVDLVDLRAGPASTPEECRAKIMRLGSYYRYDGLGAAAEWGVRLIAERYGADHLAVQEDI